MIRAGSLPAGVSLTTTSDSNAANEAARAARVSRRSHTRRLIVVMGVSGSGKSTIGTALARALQLPFLEADTLHGTHNIEKMRRGEPLDDADREPWLDALAAALVDELRYPQGVVMTCSALKRAYRDRLRRDAARLRFIYLSVSREVVEQRLRARRHPFMPESLLPSQFATLEPPARDETDTATVDANRSAPEVLEAALAAAR
jgi:gluconokinase